MHVPHRRGRCHRALRQSVYVQESRDAAPSRDEMTHRRGTASHSPYSEADSPSLLIATVETRWRRRGLDGRERLLDAVTVKGVFGDQPAIARLQD